MFAVGDRKQSIYSFQGADIDEFDRSHRLLRRAGAGGRTSHGARRSSTCRSARPRRCWSWWIAVFADPAAAAGVVEPGQTLAHYADRADHAGAVELWPLAPVPDAIEPAPWSGAGAEPGPDLRAAASGRDAGALDRARRRAAA